MKPYTPHEFKIMQVRECEPMTELLDNPEQVAQYWWQNIPKADWFDPMKEALVVLVLNTRKRIIGHNLVALGSLDTCPVAGFTSTGAWTTTSGAGACATGVCTISF